MKFIRLNFYGRDNSTSYIYTPYEQKVVGDFILLP